MRNFNTINGQRLYDLLPAIYRERDNNVTEAQVEELGDLALYLDGCGFLLDLLRNTLEQRLADAFPDNPDTGLACQDWLIPYFARLLDVHLVSPDVAGQRDEVANAISWRQRKGTLASLESIAEAITQRESEVQEGWQRVALTPRVGMPLLPAEVYGVDKVFNTGSPIDLSRHPGLPATTPDMRCASYAVRTSRQSPATRTSYFVGAPYQWVQANPHGAPMKPEGFDDVSVRTVDLRRPNWRYGRYHPKRALIYSPVPMGLFPFETRNLDWADVQNTPYLTLIYDPVQAHIHIRKRTLHPVVITGDITLSFPDMEAEIFTLEGLEFTDSVTLNNGRLRLRNIVATRIEVNTVQNNVPVLETRDCLLGEVSVPYGYADLESSTLLRAATLNKVDADNCIFNAGLNGNRGGPPENGRIRYSRVPPGLAQDIAGSSTSLLVLEAENCTDTPAVFFANDYQDQITEVLSPEAGVLAPDCPASICLGGEDGKEMGAFHQGRAGRPVIISRHQAIDVSQEHEYVLQHLVFKQGLAVNPGAQQTLRIQYVAFSNLQVDSDALTDQASVALPVLDARDCLFGALSVTLGLARLEYCSVFADTQYQLMQASECIFNGALDGAGEEGAPTAQDCIRYSRIPMQRLYGENHTTQARFPFCNAYTAVFFHQDFANACAGKPGCGVLHPATSKVIRFGAEDAGEMGAYHHWRYSLQNEAVIDKLKDYLPVGMEPVLVHDAHMHIPPQ